MDIEYLIRSLMKAHQDRDWFLFEKHLHPQVELIYFDGDEFMTIHGLKDYVKRLVSYFADHDQHYKIIDIRKTSETAAVVIMNDTSGEYSLHQMEFLNDQLHKHNMFLIHQQDPRVQKL